MNNLQINDGATSIKGTANSVHPDSAQLEPTWTDSTQPGHTRTDLTKPGHILTDPTQPYNFTIKDTIVAVLALLVGFLFWEWQVLSFMAPTFGVFIYLMSVIGITCLYMNRKGMYKDRTSLPWMILTIGASTYFFIFDNTPIHTFMLMFIVFTYIMWVMEANGTSIMKKLNGFILGDMVNQVFVIPFRNFAALFRSLFSKGRSKKKVVLSLVIGVIISIPLIYMVVILLADADEHFNAFVNDFLIKLWDLSIMEYVLEFILGIPVACYCFGFLYGNYHKRNTHIIKYQSVNTRFVNMHAVPRAAVYGPLIILNVIYITFFIVMTNYVFSAFHGDLPAALTYAQYARQGFFELCAVSAINLAVIAFAYIGVKRKEAEYPPSLRVLTGIMSLLTILLVVTNMSKMCMYISVYGLTRLRLYTMWFMIVILFVFVLIVIWHIRSYNMGRPLIIGVVTLCLALGFGNSDGIIAKHNVNSYEHGYLKELDVDMLLDMSDATRPYLTKYIKPNKEELTMLEFNIQSSSINR